jgi:hypothetical protein
MQARMDKMNRSAEGSYFKDEMEDFLNINPDRSRFKEPDEVSEAFMRALFDENPSRRYMTVPNEREAEVTIWKAIEELVQLNENNAYAYDRAALIEMLDEALAEIGD